MASCARIGNANFSRLFLPLTDPNSMNDELYFTLENSATALFTAASNERERFKKLT